MSDTAQIKDPHQAPDLTAEERRKRGLDLLRQFDEAPLQPLHVKAALITGAGFISEGFARFMLQVLLVPLGLGLFPMTGLPDHRYVEFNIVAMGGLVLGPLLFGALADRAGRKAVYWWSLALVAVGFLVGGAASFGSVYTVLTICLVWEATCAFGVGATYATGPTITSEYVPRRYRGTLTALSFSMQYIGYLFAACSALLTIWGLRASIRECPFGTSCASVNTIWRLCIGLAAVPAFLTVFLAYTFLPETPRFLVHILQPRFQGLASAGKPAAPAGPGAPAMQPSAVMKTLVPPSSPEGPALIRSAYRSSDSVRPASLAAYLAQWRHVRPILAMSLTYFLSELTGLVGTIAATASVTKALQLEPNFRQMTGLLWSINWNTILVACFMFLIAGPGYILAILGIHHWSRRGMLMAGFAACALTQALMAWQMRKGLPNHAAFVALYVIFSIAIKAGPSTVTVVLPVECFPTRFRCTLAGLVAALGHCGNLVGFFGYRAAAKPIGKYDAGQVMYAAAVVAGLGALAAWWVPEPGARALEDVEELGGGEGVGARPAAASRGVRRVRVGNGAYNLKDPVGADSASCSSGMSPTQASPEGADRSAVFLMEEMIRDAGGEGNSLMGARTPRAGGDGEVRGPEEC